jgi:hypothetical protein
VVQNIPIARFSLASLNDKMDRNNMAVGAKVRTSITPHYKYMGTRVIQLQTALLKQIRDNKMMKMEILALKQVLGLRPIVLRGPHDLPTTDPFQSANVPPVLDDDSTDLLEGFSKKRKHEGEYQTYLQNLSKESQKKIRREKASKSRAEAKMISQITKNT